MDRQTVDDFAEHERTELQRLETQLRGDSYAPAAVRRVWIPKPGGSEKRPLGIPTVRDRVVQTALLRVIEPILDATFHERSFGFRHGRSCHDALRVVEELLENDYVYVVDADLKSYLDNSKSRLTMIRRSHLEPSTILTTSITPTGLTMIHTRRRHFTVSRSSEVEVNGLSRVSSARQGEHRASTNTRH